MKSSLVVAGMAVAVLLACGCLSVVVSGQASRAALVACGFLSAFLVGLGCGERARAAYHRDITRLNRLLGQQNQDLCEANLRLLRGANSSQASPSKPASQPTESGAGSQSQ